MQDRPSFIKNQTILGFYFKCADGPSRVKGFVPRGIFHVLEAEKSKDVLDKNTSTQFFTKTQIVDK